MTIRVLLVDDQPLMVFGLRMIIDDAPDLEFAGAAGNGREAVALARQVRPDVVVMDVRMPGRDGVSVLVDSGAPPPPVILMTAYALEERLREARDKKVHAVVMKPFAPPYLLGLVASAVAA